MFALNFKTSPLKTIAAVGTLVATMLLGTGCNALSKLKARDHLNQGVNSFKAGNYTDAADNFKQAIELDPTFDVARLYLATAYVQQYIPGTETPENKKYASAAMEEFGKVLKTDPKNLLATQSVANLYYQTKDFPNAVEWNKKVTEINPQDKAAFYTLGVIAWTQFIGPDREARNASKMKPEDPCPIKDAKDRAALKEKYWQSLTDGIDFEDKALKIDPEYENAMSYKNLLLRYRADLVDTKEACLADVKQADDLMQKALETTKMKAEKKAKAGGN